MMYVIYITDYIHHLLNEFKKKNVYNKQWAYIFSS